MKTWIISLLSKLFKGANYSRKYSNFCQLSLIETSWWNFILQKSKPKTTREYKYPPTPPMSNRVNVWKIFSTSPRINFFLPALDLQLPVPVVARQEMLRCHPELKPQHGLCQVSLINGCDLLHILNGGTGSKSPDHPVRCLENTVARE